MLMTNLSTDPLVEKAAVVVEGGTQSVPGASGAALASATNAAAMMTTGLVETAGNAGKRGVMASSTKFMDWTC